MVGLLDWLIGADAEEKQQTATTYQELVRMPEKDFNKLDRQETRAFLKECNKSTLQLQKDREFFAAKSALENERAELSEYFSIRENSHPQIGVQRAIDEMKAELKAVNEKHAAKIEEARQHERQCRRKMKRLEEIRRRLLDKDFDPDAAQVREEIKNRERALNDELRELRKQEIKEINAIERISTEARLPENHRDRKLPEDLEATITALQAPHREKLAEVQAKKQDLEKQVEESRRKRAEMSAAPML